MDLTDILSAEAVRASPKPTSKKRLLQEIAGYCAQLYDLDAQLLLDKLQERELLPCPASRCRTGAFSVSRS